MGGGRETMDGVSRALPCALKRAIMGGGSDARRGCSARGVGSPGVAGEVTIVSDISTEDD